MIITCVDSCTFSVTVTWCWDLTAQGRMILSVKGTVIWSSYITAGCFLSHNHGLEVIHDGKWDLFPSRGQPKASPLKKKKGGGVFLMDLELNDNKWNKSCFCDIKQSQLEWPHARPTIISSIANPRTPWLVNATKEHYLQFLLCLLSGLSCLEYLHCVWM